MAVRLSSAGTTPNGRATSTKVDHGTNPLMDPLYHQYKLCPVLDHALCVVGSRGILSVTFFVLDLAMDRKKPFRLN